MATRLATRADVPVAEALDVGLLDLYARKATHIAAKHALAWLQSLAHKADTQPLLKRHGDFLGRFTVADSAGLGRETWGRCWSPRQREELGHAGSIA